MENLKQHFVLKILLFIILIKGSSTQCNDSNYWMRTSILESKGQMVIRWNFTKTDITMIMIGQTKGYLAVGFSPTHDLKGADVVVGWVVDGTPKLQDTFSTDGKEPVVDKIQSYQLMGGGENATHTFICFSRKRYTCDEQDFNITDGTTNVIWAINNNDPVNINGNLQYLQSKQGFKNIYLIGMVYPKQENAEEFYLRLPKQVTVKSATDTLYWCTNYKFSPFNSSRYMTGFDVVIPEQSVGVLHHVLLSLCEPKFAAEVFDKFDPNGYDCINSEYTKYHNPCSTAVVLWSEGGEDQYLPSHIAMPFGSATEDFYFQLQLHYQIEPSKQGMLDNTALRLLLTKEKPKYEAGIISTGFQVTPLFMIPSGQKEYTIPSVCAGSCLEQAFEDLSSINITGVRFHAHLSVKKARVRIFRNNKEIATISEDNFNFKFQGFRFFPEDVVVQKTDVLITECDYDTMDRNETTVISFAINQEMCSVGLIQYPRLDLPWCVTMPDREEILNLRGISAGNSTGLEGCEGRFCQSIFFYPGSESQTPVTSPQEFVNQTLEDVMIKFNNWTQDNVEKLTNIYYSKPQTPVCLTDFRNLNTEDLIPLEVPKDARSYQPPDPCSNDVKERVLIV